MSTHEIVEHIEHAAHGGHGGSGPARYIGITMALLGVMVAFCSAMVGAQRTELIKAMVEQSTRMGTYQTETMKFRSMAANSELLKALSPAKDEIEKIETTLRNKRGAGGKRDDEDTTEIKDLVASSVEDLADLLTPDHSVVVNFANSVKTYERDMKEAKEDAESYDKMIEARQDAAEGYERALLAAEIGIVIASVGLLLSNRMVWGVSVALAVICLASAGYTFSVSRHDVAAARQKIQQAVDNVIQLEKDDESE
jgi:Domain of unknown function (DUF4337)